MSKKHSGAPVWEITDHDNYYPIKATEAALPTGRLSMRWSQNQNSLYLHPIKPKTDKLFPSGMVEKVLSEVQEFWSKKDLYEKLSLLWRRNFLLWGPPGTGKSSIVEEVGNFFLAQDGFVAYYDTFLPCGLGGALQTIRGVEAKRPILVIFEDVDQMLQSGAGAAVEHDLTQFLDGGAKAENVVTIATTNYPEKLGKRLLRPGRFDLLINVPEPDTKTKIGYIRSFDPEYFTDERVEEWLMATKGLVFSDLKEVILLVLVYGKTVQEAAKSLRPENRKPNSAAAGAAELGQYI